MANTSMQRLLSNASVLPSRFHCRISGIAARLTNWLIGASGRIPKRASSRSAIMPLNGKKDTVLK
jgi:hypothetical protein